LAINHCTLRNDQEERRSHLLRGGGLKSQGEAFPKIQFLYF